MAATVSEEATASTAPVPAGLDRTETLLLVAIGVAEAIALGAGLTVGSSLWVLLVIHFITLGLLTALFAKACRQGSDITATALALMTTIMIGPVGPLAAARLVRARSSPSRAPTLVTDWYDRIAMSTRVLPEERLCEDVEVGRTLDPASPPPCSFPDSMSGGTLVARQAILGHIARHFHPAYLETLKIALASPEPAIRVQAAAVAAHISPRVRRLLADTLRAADRGPQNPLSALAVLDDLELLLGSGLLDETEQRQAVAFARRLGDAILAETALGPLDLSSAPDQAEAARLEGRLERLLVERQCFAALRNHRTSRRIRHAHPGVRLRRLVARAPRPEVAA